MRHSLVTLTPGMIDVDVPGWTLTAGHGTRTGREIACHDSFHEDDDRDLAAAQAWADGIIGRRLTWQRQVDVRSQWTQFTRWEGQ
ncbi:hypothetical protein ACFVUW_30030 [Streptomyces xiamenensis]|uniref:hypothetical protein n=1 Tax=Streptomyces xiamenensis TaxID=408015 RepID=UPI0036F14F61